MRYLIAMLLLAALAPALRAEVYQCDDANGIPRYTNLKSDLRGCKFLNVLPPDTVPGAQPEGKAAATPATAKPVWLAAAPADPDPSVRLQAIENWARGSRESLDPITYALVDSDESVRALAQELMEQVWNAKAEGQ